jgi:hypothetical protein
LTSLHCGIKIPLKADFYSFIDIDKNACTLYVPIGSKNLYQTAVYWKDFKNIVEVDNVGVETSAVADISLYPNPVTNHFSISGLSGEAELKLLNVNGQIVLQKKVMDNSPVNVDMIKSGVYIVSLRTSNGTRTFKMVKE